MVQNPLYNDSFYLGVAMGYNPRQKLIETQLSDDHFKNMLGLALAGGKEHKKVIWTTAGGEVVVHLQSLQVAVCVGKIIVGLRLECDEFGLQELVIPFVVGDNPENAFLLAVMPKTFGGHQGLARTWGDVAAKFVWQACIESLQMTWHEEQGLEQFRIHGLIGGNKEIRGLFAYPEDGDSPDVADTGHKTIAEIVDSIDVAQIHLGLWKGGPLVPQYVDKVGGRVSVVRFENGVEMKSADVAALIKKKKVKVAGVTAVRKGGKLFLRAKPDKKSDNNLLNLKKIPR